MHEIGHLLGLGHAYDLPAETVMGQGENSEYIASPSAPLDDDSEYYDAASEDVFPGDADIIHGQYLYRPDSNDVDVYQFTLVADGTLNAETVAERMDNSSLLDSVLTRLRRRRQPDRPKRRLLQRRLVRLRAALARHVLRRREQHGQHGVRSRTWSTAALGGTSQGDYDLRLTFLPSRLDDGTGDAEHMVDTTGTMLDGDADGVPGGVYNFWFNVETLENTHFRRQGDHRRRRVRLGTLANPYSDIDDALAAAQPGDIVRIVGNRDRTFLEQETFEVGVDPQQTAVGDLDGDGAADLVVTNQDDGTVSVLYGLGDGTFWAPVTLDVGNSPTGLQLGDVNGDGRLGHRRRQSGRRHDLAVAQRREPELRHPDHAVRRQPTRPPLPWVISTTTARRTSSSSTRATTRSGCS